MLGTLALVVIPAGVFVTAYRATGLFAHGTMIGNVLRGGTLVVLATILYAGSGPALFASVTLVAGLIRTVVITRDVRRQIPASRRIRLGLKTARAGFVHLGGSLYFWLLALATALNYQGVILVLGMNVPLEIVAVYATHRSACGLIGYIGSLIQSPLWPELTFFHTQGRREDLSRVALLAVKTVVLLSGFAAIGLWLFLPLIYPIWTGRQLQFQPVLLSLFLLQAVLMAGWSTSAWSLLSSNQHRRLALWSLINAVLTIFLAVILGPRFGAVGVLLATLLGDVICGFAVYPRLASQGLGLPGGQLYVAIVWPMAVLLPVGLILLTSSSLIGHWLGAAVGVLLGLLLFYPTVRMALGRQDMNLLVEKFSGILPFRWIEGGR